jgi:hypothetical protein
MFFSFNISLPLSVFLCLFVLLSFWHSVVLSLFLSDSLSLSACFSLLISRLSLSLSVCFSLLSVCFSLLISRLSRSVCFYAFCLSDIRSLYLSFFLTLWLSLPLCMFLSFNIPVSHSLCFFCLSVSLSLCKYVFFSVYPSIYLCPSVSLLFIYLSVSLSLSLSVCLPFSAYFSLFISVSLSSPSHFLSIALSPNLSLSVCVSVSLSLSTILIVLDNTIVTAAKPIHLPEDLRHAKVIKDMAWLIKFFHNHRYYTNSPTTSKHWKQFILGNGGIRFDLNYLVFNEMIWNE